MNKTLVLIVLGILLATGGLYYYTSGRANVENPQSTSETTTESDSDNSGSLTSLKNLLGRGQNMMCTFSSDGTSGTIYIAGDRIRGDFSVSDGSSISMIQDGGWMYYWGSTMAQGMKMQINLDELAEDYSTGDIPSLSQSLDVDAQMNYDCDNWNVDSSRFEVPSNVEFVDFSQQFSY